MILNLRDIPDETILEISTMKQSQKTENNWNKIEEQTRTQILLKIHVNKTAVLMTETPLDSINDQIAAKQSNTLTVGSSQSLT